MSQNFPTDAGVLITPGGYARYNVVAQNNGIATTGIVMLVGEADAGPDYSQEDDLASNIFGPGQIGDVKAKYKTGRLVDAFNMGTVPANDTNIQGAPAGFILVKTNPSTKASSILAHWDDTNYGTLQDKSWGKLGNLIKREVTAKTEEVVPATGEFAIATPGTATNISARVNGGSVLSYTIGAGDDPSDTASGIGALTGLDCDGGAARTLLANTTGTLAITVLTGNKVQIDRSIPFNNLPTIGDALFIPTTSAMATTNAAAAGSYIVTGKSASQILATKILDATGAGTITPPTTKGATAIVATDDVEAWSPLNIHLVDSVDPIDGYGKNLTIDELTTGTDILSSLCWVLEDGVATKVDWINKEDETHVILGTEYVATLTESRDSDGVTNDISAGGLYALKIGYDGTTASAEIDGTNIVLTTTGGSFASSPATIALADHPTLSDLAQYIDTLDGFTCTTGASILSGLPSTALDQGTFGICATWADHATARLKVDAYKFFTALRDNGFLTELDEQADSGLPAPTTGVSFLSGGAKGATSDAIFAAALDALKLVRGNFVVPLVSRDAADDIADGQTDPSSSYTIEAVHSNTRAHVLQMSTLKKRRNRQAFLSLRSDLDAVKDASSELASFRCSLAFQDIRDRSIAGAVTQFQPWANAVKAACMQAAGFYRAIFNKGIAISGALQAAGDFNDQDDDAVEQALEAGLLIIQRPAVGGFKYVSDQTTYSRDNNFVYNSIQAVYVADIIALTTAQVMEQMFVGQSLADVTAAQALSVLDSIMENLKRLKLIAFSDDAPKGYKNPQIKITGPAMVVSAEVKAATSIYFIPITFSITQIVQSA